MSDTNFMSYSDAETVVTGIADKYKTFKGTQAQWDALSLSEKVKYSFADITDDYAGTGVVDAVTNGDMNPVTSNAVYDYLNRTLTITKLENETYGEMLDRLFAAIDLDKVTPKTALVVGTAVHHIVTWSTAELRFIRERVGTGTSTFTILENYTVKRTGSAVSTSSISEGSTYAHSEDTENAGPYAITIYY